jgi:hypothetical protein
MGEAFEAVCSEQPPCRTQSSPIELLERQDLVSVTPLVCGSRPPRTSVATLLVDASLLAVVVRSGLAAAQYACPYWRNDQSMACHE